MLEELKIRVLEANKRLVRPFSAAAVYGGASEIDRETGLFVIPPEGVPYGDMAIKDLHVFDLMGNILEGALRPAVDLLTHVELYSAFEEIGGIAVTHLPYATAFAQAGRDIPVYGAVHAFGFFGDIPCVTVGPDADEDFERSCAYAVIESTEGCDPLELPAVLVRAYGAITFGKDAASAVDAALRLEEVARLALYSELLDPDITRLPDRTTEQHFSRLNGKHFDK